MAGLNEQLSGIHDQIVNDGFIHAVVIGMGGSSMTPLTIANVFKNYPDDRPSQIQLHTIDTINPKTVAELTGRLDLGKTLFFVSSKSGTTIETLSLEAFFRDKLLRIEDKANDSRKWVVLTDSATPLSEKARSGEYGTWVTTPNDVGGRFSALSAFGMMPAAAMGLEISEFAKSASNMAQRCQFNQEDNPGLKLGAFLAANALNDKDKVTLITSEKFSIFGLWVEQLLAESTGKNGKGLIPITGEKILHPKFYGSDRQFVIFDDNKNSLLDNPYIKPLASQHPTMVIKASSPSPYELGGEFFRWQFATAAAASLLKIYPFDQPDVDSAKTEAKKLLSNQVINIDNVSVNKAIEQIKNGRPPRYVAIVAYLNESEELTSAFSELRKVISQKTNLATTFGYGPRYLHSTGQIYKGGRQDAIVLGFVSGKYDHLAVPGEAYTFGQLCLAQSGADFSVMTAGGQKVLAIVTGDNPIDDVNIAAQRMSE